MIYSLFIEIKGILPKPIINGELERLAERIRTNYVYNNPRLPEIITAASLAQHGFLRPVERMRLSNVDLASVPAKHMASLAACVTDRVIINNVHNCDLINILDNIECQSCYIHGHSLNREESLALVRAMETRVEKMTLGGEVNIKFLTQYNGEGSCWLVEYYGDRYREEIRSWAQSISWDVMILHYGITIKMTRR